MAKTSTQHDAPVYVIRKTRLGMTLAAATDRGICLLAFADRRDELQRALSRRCPNALPAGPRHPSMHRLQAALKWVTTPWNAVSPPLDLRGTPFQQAVWRALRRVPSGRTATYLDVARAIGRPRATRAVAGACGANPVAIAVPCHRIVRSDGSLSGYRWGVSRKRALLALEAKRAR